MNCEKAQSLMLDHLYGELKPRKQAALKRHLQACSGCAEEFAAHKATASTFKKLEIEEPPSGITRNIAAMAAEDIEQNAPARARSAWYWKPAMATAAAVALVTITFISMPYVRRSEESAAIKTIAMKMDKPSEMAEMKKSRGSAGPEDAGSIEGKGLFDYDVSSEPMAESAPVVMMGDMMDDKNEVGRRSKYSVHDALSIRSNLEQKPDLALRRQESRDRSDIQPPAAPAPTVGRSISNGFYAASGAATPQKQVLSETEEMPAEKLMYAGTDETADLQTFTLKKAREESAKENILFDEREMDTIAANYRQTIGGESKETIPPEVWFQLGRKYQDSELYEKAVPVYKEIIENYPDYPEMANVHIAIGNCHLMMGEIENALLSFKLVYKDFPASREIAQERILEAVSQKKSAETKAEEPAGTKE